LWGFFKATARRPLGTNGANLSLCAVARDVGMASSALYRYFASRDELLTALIIDAYNGLGSAAEAEDAAIADRANLRGRWMGICQVTSERASQAGAVGVASVGPEGVAVAGRIVSAAPRRSFGGVE